MKISIDGKELFALSETQKNVIKNDIQSEVFEEDMARRLQYILTHKYERCFERLQKEWLPKLKKAGIASIPLDEEEFARLVLSQPDYKSRSQRDAQDPVL